MTAEFVSRLYKNVTPDEWVYIKPESVRVRRFTDWYTVGCGIFIIEIPNSASYRDDLFYNVLTEVANGNSEAMVKAVQEYAESLKGT